MNLGITWQVNSRYNLTSKRDRVKSTQARAKRLDMELQDFLALIHPALAVTIVFPCLGIVVNLAWHTRQRRLLPNANNNKSIVLNPGLAHVELGRWLTGLVVTITLIGLAYPIFEHIVTKQLWKTAPLKSASIALIFMDTLACLLLLYSSKKKIWRAVFASLTGAGLVILGCQDGVFRRTNEWYWSHYYIGIAATMLMIFSLSIAPDIYQDKSNRWRIFHIILNVFALLLFVGQGFTGTRDLLEMPLSWQEKYIYTCDFITKIAIHH